MSEPRLKRGSDILLLTGGMAVALCLRFYFRDFESGDYRSDTSHWYAAIRQFGLAATGTSVSNYTPPYLYLLYLVSLLLPSLPGVVAIKIPSVVFDFVCGAFVYRIVSLKYPRRRVAVWSFISVLLAPTVVTNGSVWGQADSIYTAMLLVCVYGLMTGRAVSAMLAFGTAFALKLQAIFLAPCIGALWLRRRIPLPALLLVPLVYAVAMIPAWLEGRSAHDLVTIYWLQSGVAQLLTRNAPNLYAWLQQDYQAVLTPAGLVLTTVMGGLLVAAVWKSPASLSPDLILKLSLLSLLLVPYLLPRMHDRFFYPADVVSIAYGFYFPLQWYVPVLISLASILAYAPFLAGHSILPLQILALVMAAALAAVALSVYRDLRLIGK